jgi:hypothetical protein
MVRRGCRSARGPVTDTAKGIVILASDDAGLVDAGITAQ